MPPRSISARNRVRAVPRRAARRRPGLFMAVAILVTAAVLLAIAWHFAFRSLDSLPAREELARASADASQSERRGVPTRVVDEPARPVRYVERDGIVGPRVDGALQRLEKLEAFGPPSPAPPRGPAPDIHKLVVIENAGLINVRSHRIRLAHIVAPDETRLCQRDDGGSWPCGRRARTELRRLVRRRDIACSNVPVAGPAEEGVVTAECSVGGTNMSRWLVEHGWALPDKGAPKNWDRLHETAKLAGRGLFASNPR